MSNLLKICTDSLLASQSENEKKQRPLCLNCCCRSAALCFYNASLGTEKQFAVLLGPITNEED